MCGIAGIISINSELKNITSQDLPEALDLLSHRGPDDMGYQIYSTNKFKIELGQTRLSIIDLSPAGHQPFESHDGNWVLVFNGEIYNYKELRSELKSHGVSFKSNSDTEVLLNSWIYWGPNCLPKLKGMFAFAILDRKNNLLTCVRDAFGIKPFFYSNNATSFAFASEILALRKIVSISKINNKKMFEYLAVGSYDNSYETFFEDIYNLEPAHILTVDFSDLDISYSNKRWWWPDVSENRTISESEAITGIRERFLENIKLHLRSDVPIGAALSGGIDSSSIVSAMRYLEPELDINTFSFISPGDAKNEEPWIDLVNNHVKAKAHKVSISPSELAKDLDDMIFYQGEPFGSTSIYAQYRVYKLAKDSGVTVNLDGQGADELFAGYSGYPEWRFRSLLASGKIFESLDFLNQWRREPGRSFSQGLQSVVGVLTPDFLMHSAYKFTNRHAPLDLFDSSVLNLNELNFQYPLSSIKEIGWKRALASRLRYALTKGELSQLLRHGDRNSMRWSIESRVPFLTTDFAEYVLTLPENYLISNKGVTKYLFREAMRGIVPDKILDRKDKIGFETPEIDLLLSSRKMLAKWLEGLDLIPWIDKDYARKYINLVLDGNLQFNGVVWRLINASKWAQLSVK